LFGSIDKSIQQFEEKFNHKFNTPLTIIESGCLGLMTVVKLIHEEIPYNNTAKSYDYLASHTQGDYGHHLLKPQTKKKIMQRVLQTI